MKDPELDIHFFHENPCKIVSLGDRESILQSIVSPNDEKTIYNAEDFLWGSGGATPKNIESIGESVIINGMCYTRSTDENSPEYLSIINGSKFRSVGSHFIPKDTKPNGFIKNNDTIHLSKFAHELTQEIDSPVFLVIGLGKFKSVYVNILHKPPIHGIPYVGNKKHFYPFPSKTIHNVFGFFMAIIRKKDVDEQIQKRFINPIEERYEYDDLEAHKAVNAFENDFFYRGRLLVLNRPIHSYNEITPKDVSNIWTVYMKDTYISKFKGDFFLVNDFIKNLAK